MQEKKIFIMFSELMVTQNNMVLSCSKRFSEMKEKKVSTNERNNQRVKSSEQQVESDQ